MPARWMFVVPPLVPPDSEGKVEDQNLVSVHFVLQEQALDQENVRVTKNQSEHDTNAKEEDELEGGTS